MTYGNTLRALGDPTRQAIMERLRGGPMPVGELADGLPVSRPAVSQHLKILKTAGLVSDRKVGTRRIYNVDLRGLQELRGYLDRFWDDVLEAFKTEAGRVKGWEDEDRQHGVVVQTCAEDRHGRIEPG